MSQQIIDRYVADVHACLKKASEMFGVNLNPANVVIDCDLLGRTAGWAHPAKAGKYRLRFNKEAIVKFPEKMADTIPHEVAHLVCFANPSYGRHHDQGWKRVCRRLGGDESRTHDMLLTPTKEKKIVRHRYNVAGEVCTVGPRQHARIQDGFTGYIYSHRKTGKNMAVFAWMHMPEATVVKSNMGTEWKPADATGGASKRERAAAIFTANPSLTRKEMIALFVAKADMTPAGAATYYQTFKSKGV